MKTKRADNDVDDGGNCKISLKTNANDEHSDSMRGALLNLRSFLALLFHLDQVATSPFSSSIPDFTEQSTQGALHEPRPMH
jgi:hypothetical protein